MATASPETPPDFSYPPVEDSPYAVAQTTRRERWWYSDGIWLDQGKNEAVVGFGWTHWLADRGVRVPDVELGEDYARELQREAQRIEGRLVGQPYGARVEAAAAVLQSRGVVRECYSFQKIDSVVNTLLERGPVVAGIRWGYREVDYPKDLEGCDGRSHQG